MCSDPYQKLFTEHWICGVEKDRRGSGQTEKTLFWEALRMFVSLLGPWHRQITHVFSQTTALTGTICGTICEDSSPLKCESVASIEIHTTTSSRQAWLQVPHGWRTNRKDHPVTNKLPRCHHRSQRWPCPTDLSVEGAEDFILKSALLS